VDSLAGQVGHLLRTRTFGKGSAKNMQFRKPFQFSILVRALDALMAKVDQEQNEREKDCRIRVR
jgi:hypothetical protein